MTWEGVLKSALGVLGMRSEDFWNETPYEFALRLQGFYERQEAQERSEWERMRLVAYYAVAPHLKRATTLQRFMPLPWDKAQRPERDPVDPDELKRIQADIDKISRGLWHQQSGIS